MEKTELSKAEWLSKAERYCARAEHCAADVQRKLYEWGAPADLSGFIDENLYANGFLHDDRYCRAYVHDKVEYHSWGRLKIRAGLQALQLPSCSVREALGAIDENVYFRNLRSLIRSRQSDPEEKRLRFLLQRGFTCDEIKKCTF